MITTKIISSGAYGPESAAPDLAIKLEIQHGGFAPKKTGRYGAKVTSRFDLTEKPFESPLDAAKANMDEADGTLFFTQGKPDNPTQYLIDHATEQDHPIWQIDFDQVSPLLAGFQINIWLSKHSIVTLHVTGSDEPDLYQEVYETLYGAFILGNDFESESVKPAFYRIPIPKTVDEAVQIQMDELSLKDKVAIANMNADEVENLHFGLGMFIRNRFGFWEGNPRLLLDCAEDAGRPIEYADEASAVIIGRLALELERKHKLRSV